MKRKIEFGPFMKLLVKKKKDLIDTMVCNHVPPLNEFIIDLGNDTKSQMTLITNRKV